MIKNLFSVNPYSSVPVYKQLKNQVIKALQWGTLKSGEQLPTIKELSSFLSINPNTVARVFRELTIEGYIKSEPGVGTFILAISEERNYREKKEQLTFLLKNIIREGRIMGLERNEISDLWQETFKEFQEDRN